MRNELIHIYLIKIDHFTFFRNTVSTSVLIYKSYSVFCNIWGQQCNCFLDCTTSECRMKSYSAYSHTPTMKYERYDCIHSYYLTIHWDVRVAPLTTATLFWMTETMVLEVQDSVWFNKWMRGLFIFVHQLPTLTSVTSGCTRKKSVDKLLRYSIRPTDYSESPFND